VNRPRRAMRDRHRPLLTPLPKWAAIAARGLPLPSHDVPRVRGSRSLVLAIPIAALSATIRRGDLPIQSPPAGRCLWRCLPQPLPGWKQFRCALTSHRGTSLHPLPNLSAIRRPTSGFRTLPHS